MKTVLRIVLFPVYVLSNMCLLNKWAWKGSCWSEDLRYKRLTPLFFDSIWPSHYGKVLIRLPVAVLFALPVICIVGMCLFAVPMFYLMDWLEKISPRIISPLRSFYRRIYDAPMCGDREEQK